MDDRFRVTLTPEDHQWAEARDASWWPSFDVIGPPTWLALDAGRQIFRESFDRVRPALAREGYEFSVLRKAWIRN